MMQKVLITGASGLVGSRLAELLSKDFQIITPDEKELDILDFSAVADFLDSTKPDTIINCAAYTDVTATENQRGDTTAIAYRLNVDATENLAKLCNQKNIFLIQISTEFIFPGTAEHRGPYTESSQPSNDPDEITWYGWTKVLAEQKVLNFPNTAIVRITYPVSPEAHEKLDFMRKILALYDAGKLYPMLTDQFSTTTDIDDLALALEKIITDHRTDVWHVSSSDTFTPYELSSYLIEHALNQRGVVQPITLEELKIKTGNSRYPQFGGLDVRATEQKLGIQFKSWKETVGKLNF